MRRFGLYFSRLLATDELATGFQPRICDPGVVLDGFAVRMSGRFDRVNLNDIGSRKSFGSGRGSTGSGFVSL